MIVTKKFKVVFILATVLNILDLYSTYYVTPDLSNEGNFWVKKLLLGWTGLIITLLAYQIIYLAIFFFHSDIFKKRNYAIRKNNSPFQVLKIYFFNKDKVQWDIGSIIDSIKSIINYLGVHFISLYFVSKFFAICDNFLFGFFLRKVTVLSKKNEITNVKINYDDPFWSSTFGKFLNWFCSLDYFAKHNFFSISLTVVGVLVLISFIIKQYWIAISTPRFSSR